MKRSRHDDNLAFRARTGQLSKVPYSKAPAATPYDSYRKKYRPAGPSLKPSDVPGLVEAALVDGPIKPGEAFEHLITVLCDGYRFHAYHFIVAPARSVGGRRRAVLLSERTVNGSVDYEKQEAYVQRLTDYATALGSPRVLIHSLSWCGDLPRLLWRMPALSFTWSMVNLQCRPESEQLRGQYLDGYALAFDRYKQGAIMKAIKCPPIETLASQMARVAQHVDRRGLIALTKPGDRMDRELEALCLLCLDEESERLKGADCATMMAG